MRSLIKLTVTFLLVFVFLMPALSAGAEPKNPTVLLREGIYVEQTEGDIERAIEIYTEVLDQAAEVHRLAARACYQLGMCYLKRGENEAAVEYFKKVLSQYPDQMSVMKMAKIQLEQLECSDAENNNIFEMLGQDICSYLGSKYGEICAEAGMKQLYSNSHIYVVDSDFILRGGGMGYVYNLTEKPITERYRLSGTTYPNQKLYSILNEEMDIEIVPDENRKSFYHIYWNPEEPLGPGEFFNYGWVIEGNLQLSEMPGEGKYLLNMQNNFGQLAYETFFLAVRQGTVLSDLSEEYTGKKTFNGWDIYWWKKVVQQDENHKVTLSLRKPVYTQQLKAEINKDGLLNFKTKLSFKNDGDEAIASTSFINSDFVNVSAMYDDQNRPLEFSVDHQDDIYRYFITFNEPVLPGQTTTYCQEGTMVGLIKKIPDSKDVFWYHMVHSPGTAETTLRIEKYLLPEGAKIISTSPGMRATEKDGRTELSVEKLIPIGGNIVTQFKYKLTDSGQAKLDLIDAPWQNGEHMRLRLVTPSGMEIGETVYKVTTFEQDGQKVDRVESWLTVSSANMNQYTAVEAEHETFAPLRGMTINNAGDFISIYQPDNVTLTTVSGGNEKTSVIETPGLVFDNEQAMYLIRRLPFEGDRSLFNFEIFPPQSSAVSTCRIKVLDIEDVTVPLGTFECYKLRLNVVHDGMNALEHKLWITTDPSRTLVKYDAGQAVMELTELEILDPAMPVVVEDEKFSLKLPADWQYLAGDARLYDVWIALMPPRLDVWAVLAGKGLDGPSPVESPRMIAEMDAETLKGFFKNYTIDEQSWDETEVSGSPAASYTASYIEDGKEMIEYRTYIKARGMVYWFVFREQAKDFAGIKPTLDSIVAGFEVK